MPSLLAVSYAAEKVEDSKAGLLAVLQRHPTCLPWSAALLQPSNDELLPQLQALLESQRALYKAAEASKEGAAAPVEARLPHPYPLHPPSPAPLLSFPPRISISFTGWSIKVEVSSLTGACVTAG